MDWEDRGGGCGGNRSLPLRHSTLSFEHAVPLRPAPLQPRPPPSIVASRHTDVLATARLSEGRRPVPAPPRLRCMLLLRACATDDGRDTVVAAAATL